MYYYFVSFPFLFISVYPFSDNFLTYKIVYKMLLLFRPKVKSIGDQLREKNEADQVDFRDVLIRKTLTKEQEELEAEQIDFRNVRL